LEDKALKADFMHIGRTLGVIGVVIFVSFSSMAQYTKYQPVGKTWGQTGRSPVSEKLGNKRKAVLPGVG
jgi:hypothetical protein